MTEHHRAAGGARSTPIHPNNRTDSNLNSIKPMKPNPLARLTLIGALVLSAYPIAAQTFTTLHSFTMGGNNSSGFYTSTNSDGAYPLARLILSGNTLYGTAAAGGSSGSGAVFAANTD